MSITIEKEELIRLAEFCLSEGYLEVFDGIEAIGSDTDGMKAKVIVDNLLNGKPLNESLK